MKHVKAISLYGCTSWRIHFQEAARINIYHTFTFAGGSEMRLGHSIQVLSIAMVLHCCLTN